MKLVIASNNKHKIKEIKDILGEYFEEVLSMTEAGCYDDIVEDGETFEDNSLIKARHVMKKLGCAAIADDSGLEVFALDSRPGIYSARYAGVHGDDEANNDKLLEEMKSVEEKKRTAQYVCAIALCRPNMIELTSRGTCPGRILKKRVGDGGFGYDPLFHIEVLDKTMAELTSDEKNKISHRFFALKGIKSLLESEK